MVVLTIHEIKIHDQVIEYFAPYSKGGTQHS
jgi:hypothetical protein